MGHTEGFDQVLDSLAAFKGQGDIMKTVGRFEKIVQLGVKAEKCLFGDHALPHIIPM